MANDPWDEFLDHTQAYADRCRADLSERFAVGTHERFDCDLETGRFTFSNGGEVVVEAQAVVAGTFSDASKTWLWSWANPHLPDVVKQRVAVVEEYGRSQEFEHLTNEKFDSTEADSWWLAAAACYVLRGDGIYRVPGKTGATFLVLFDVRQAGTESD